MPPKRTSRSPRRRSGRKSAGRRSKARRSRSGGRRFRGNGLKVLEAHIDEVSKRTRPNATKIGVWDRYLDLMQGPPPMAVTEVTRRLNDDIKTMEGKDRNVDDDAELVALYFIRDSVMPNV